MTAAETPSARGELPLLELAELARRFVALHLSEVFLGQAPDGAEPVGTAGERSRLLHGLIAAPAPWSPGDAAVQSLRRRARACLAGELDAPGPLAAALRRRVPDEAAEALLEAWARSSVPDAAADFRRKAIAALLALELAPESAATQAAPVGLEALERLAGGLEKRGLDGLGASLGTAAGLFFGISRNLFVWHRRGGPGLFGDGAAARHGRQETLELDRIEKLLDEQLDELAGMPVGAGDLLAGMLSILSLRALVAGCHWDGDPWSGLARERATTVSVRSLARLAGCVARSRADRRVLWLCGGSSTLHALARVRPPLAPVAIGAAVSKELARIDAFAAWLLRAQEGSDPWRDEAAPRRPLAVGAIGPRALEGFDLLDSGVIRPPTRGVLAQALRAEFLRHEGALFEGSARPRGTLAGELVLAAGGEFVVARGERFALSARGLTMCALCHDALLGQVALWEQESALRAASAVTHAKTRKDLEELARAQGAIVQGARASSDHWRDALARGVPTAADMLVARLLLSASARLLARRAPAGGNDALGRATRPWRDDLLLIAATSPLVQLLEPELRAELENAPEDAPAGLRAWRFLKEFLGDERAAPFQRWIVARWVRSAGATPSEALLHELRTCLDADALGGALLVGRFFGALCRQVFCAQELVTRRPAARREAERGDPTSRMRAWFWTLDPAHAKPAQVLRLLVDVMRRTSHGSSAQRAADARLRAVDRAWHEIADCALRGLGTRPWDSKYRHLLQSFWLDFCRVALLEPRAGLLGLGAPRWDDPAELGARLFAQLEHVRRARERRVAAVDPGAATAGAPAPPTRAERQLEQDFQHVGALLRQIASHRDGLGSALRVRRILAPTAGGARQHAVDDQRLTEYAAS